MCLTRYAFWVPKKTYPSQRARHTCRKDVSRESATGRWNEHCNKTPPSERMELSQEHWSTRSMGNSSCRCPPGTHDAYISHATRQSRNNGLESRYLLHWCIDSRALRSTTAKSDVLYLVLFHKSIAMCVSRDDEAGSAKEARCSPAHLRGHAERVELFYGHDLRS